MTQGRSARAADVSSRSHRGLYGRAACEQADRRHAPGARPRDLRLRAGRRDRGPGARDRRGDAARGPRSREPRVLLLTHIHLDHAGASGVLVRRFPDLQVYVHERGAPHLIDPSQAPEERRAALRRRHGAALGRGGAGAGGARAHPVRRRDGGGLPRGLHAGPRLAPRVLPARGLRRRLRGRRGRRARAAARLHRSAHAAARHRPGAVGGLAATRSRAGTPRRLPHPLRPARRRGRADRERPRGARRVQGELARDNDEEGFIAPLGGGARANMDAGRPRRASSRPRRPTSSTRGSSATGASGAEADAA